MKKIIIKDHWIILMIIIATLGTGFVFSLWTARLADQRMRAELITQAKFLGNSINWRFIPDLTASSYDLDSPKYQRLKEQLTLVRAANPFCRFVYILGQKPDGTIYFFIDSEPPDSVANYSPPGQIYEEASEGVRQIFIKGSEITEGPLADRWGTWISAMVPINNPNSGKRLAVLGMDFDAHDWKIKILNSLLIPLSTTLLVLIIETVFLMLRHRTKSENKRLAISEQVLMKSKTQLHAILQSTADGILAIDHEGKVLLANKRFLDLWRIPEEILVKGTHQALLDHVINQLTEPEPFLIKIRSLSNSKLVDFDTLFFKDGRVFERYSCPLTQGREENVGRVWSFRDITQKVKIKNELLSAKEKAEESDRLKSAFLANMSHEIRTPMNAIVGFSGILSDPDTTEEERAQYSGIIQSRSDDLLHIINDILEISRIESGNASIVSDEVNLNNLLHEIELITTQKMKRVRKSQLQLICEIPASEREFIFLSDPYVIKQVFYNLLDNAIKYTESGSIRFGFHTPAEGMILFFVTDTGIGITPENQKIIFKHFRQAEIQDSHRYGGSGLGLSICKGSLALLSGEIWVESEPEKGSTFFFRLPYQYVSVKTPKVESKNTQTQMDTQFQWNGKKILIVEDENTNMEFLSIILRKTGAELVCAENGEALRKLYDRLGTFHFVLLDIRLPDVNGWDLAKEIKDLCPGLPVIAQTAYALSSDRIKSEEACDGFIPKPINRDLLLKLMSEYLG